MSKWDQDEIIEAAPQQSGRNEDLIVKRATPKAPNVPTGYEVGPDGVARRIPGLPAEKGSSVPEGWGTIPSGWRIKADGSGIEPIPGSKADTSAGEGVQKALTANKRSEMKDTLSSLEQFERDLVNLENSFSKNFDKQGLGTVRELLPEALSPTNQTYNAASKRLLPLVAKALGFTSKQMDTPAEIARLEAYVPSAGDFDETARDKLKVLRDMLNTQRANLNAQLAGPEMGGADEELNLNKDIEDLPKRDGAPQSGGQVAGEGLKGFRFSPEAEREIVQYARSPEFTPEGYAALVTKHGVAEGFIPEASAQAYTAQMTDAARTWQDQVGADRARFGGGLDYGDLDKKALEDAGLLEGLLQAGANMPESAANLIQGLTALPVDAIASVFEGERVGALKSTTDLVAELAAMAGIGDAKPETINAVAQMFEDRYGGLDNIKRTLIEDPLGVAGDASMVLSGGGSAAARAPGMVGRAGQAVARAGRVIDPLSATVGLATEGLPAAYRAAPGNQHVTNAASNIASLPGLAERYGIGLTTGAGPESLRLANEVGFQRGRHGPDARTQNFEDNMRGRGLDDAEVVAQARQALAGMRAEAQKQYRSGMVNIQNDRTVLDFADIDAAINRLRSEVYDANGNVRSTEKAAALEALVPVIDDWRNRDPAVSHTPEGLDDLKQELGDIAQRWQGDNSRTQSRIATGLYNAVKNTITQQAPTYANVMREYSDAMESIGNVEKGLSLGRQTGTETSLRKLQSVTRNNANTNFGYRTGLMELLDQYNPGGPSLSDTVHAQDLSSVVPRGLQKAVAGGFGLGGVTLGSLSSIPTALAATLPALTASSPRLMGELHYGAGRAAGATARVGSQALQSLADAYNVNPGAFLAASRAGSYAHDAGEETRLPPELPLQLLSDQYLSDEEKKLYDFLQ